MGEVIHIRDRRQRRNSSDRVPSGPWEFRKAPWRTPFFTQMARPLADQLSPFEDPIPSVPPHFTLNHGLACTIQAMYANRRDETRMRQTYYLVGLTDCMINQVNPILRTDVLRAMYKKVFAMKADFNIHWHGTLEQVLLPIDARFYDEAAYRSMIRQAATLQTLYRAIREGTDAMFDILSREYVFFCPSIGG